MLNVLLIPKWKGRFFLEEEAKMEFLTMSQKKFAVQKYAMQTSKRKCCLCAKANIIYQNQFKTTFEFYSVNIIL